jgi:hypothetical protein
LKATVNIGGKGHVFRHMHLGAAAGVICPGFGKIKPPINQSMAPAEQLCSERLNAGAMYSFK